MEAESPGYETTKLTQFVKGNNTLFIQLVKQENFTFYVTDDHNIKVNASLLLTLENENQTHQIVNGVVSMQIPKF